jgi:uncharacterized C2H2 Zn-finger protein
MTDDNIIQLDIIRVERHKARKCVCDQSNKKFTVDEVNREISCKCGLVVDPFEAMLYLSEHYENLNRQHMALREQGRQWIKEKPHSVIFKNLERHYSKGEMLPYCPECDKLFDYKDIKGHGNARFYKKKDDKKP